MTVVHDFTTEEVALLARVPLFAGLDEAELEKVASNLQRRTYRRGEVIYHEGDIAGGLFILLKGKAKTRITLPTEKQMTFRVMGGGSSFGMVSLIDDERRTTDAVAIERCEMAIWEKESFLEFLWSHPSVIKAALRRLAGQYRGAVRSFYDLALLNVPGRLAKTLLQYAGYRPGNEVLAGVELSLAELASLVGATRQSISKWLGFFAHEGWIGMERGTIEVLAPLELEHFYKTN
jgi:CRP-like cAMP-binding protein